MMEVLPKRFAKYGLTLHPEKTRLVSFGRYAEEEAKRQGKKPATFDFLGFTHICARSRRGKFTVNVRTMKKRLRRGLTAIAEWCQQNRHEPVDEQQKTLNAPCFGATISTTGGRRTTGASSSSIGPSDASGESGSQSPNSREVVDVGEILRARSWKRRTQPRNTYSAPCSPLLGNKRCDSLSERDPFVFKCEQRSSRCAKLASVLAINIVTRCHLRCVVRGREQHAERFTSASCGVPRASRTRSPCRCRTSWQRGSSERARAFQAGDGTLSEGLSAIARSSSEIRKGRWQGRIERLNLRKKPWGRHADRRRVEVSVLPSVHSLKHNNALRGCEAKVEFLRGASPFPRAGFAPFLPRNGHLRKKT